MAYAVSIRSRRSAHSRAIRSGADMPPLGPSVSQCVLRLTDTTSKAGREICADAQLVLNTIPAKAQQSFIADPLSASVIDVPRQADPGKSSGKQPLTARVSYDWARRPVDLNSRCFSGSASYSTAG